MEATIDELHAAIKSGQTTCVAIVRQYLDRVRAYTVSPACWSLKMERPFRKPRRGPPYHTSGLTSTSDLTHALRRDWPMVAHRPA